MPPSRKPTITNSYLVNNYQGFRKLTDSISQDYLPSFGSHDIAVLQLQEECCRVGIQSAPSTARARINDLCEATWDIGGCEGAIHAGGDDVNREGPIMGDIRHC